MAINEKTFTAGAVLTASDVNAYLMNQAVKYSTAGSRPASPAEGQVIYDRDTDKLLVYTTGTTQWQPPWNLPWGYIAQASITANVNFTTLADITGLSTSFTAVANRRYRISAHLRGYSSVANDTLLWYITDSANTVVGSGGLLSYTNTGAVSSRVEAYVTGSGSVTYKVRAERATGGSGTCSAVALSTAPCVLTVEDIGPSAAPA